MSKPGKARYRLETVKRSFVDALGGEDIEFEQGPDDKVFSFPHPVFMPDEMQKEINKGEGDDASARALLGDQYPDFIAAGGDVNALALLYVSIRNEAQDKVQRVRPTKG
ncbi:hypothetical protein [Streptomyces sp. NPDC006856]|uniref:hypothetical protein n=1 Tax=Streptomyces sp. NPDC006856 TaxID=3364766 RepID=UPI00367C80A9